MNFTNPHLAEPKWLLIALIGSVLLFVLQRYASRARSKQLGIFAAAQLLESLIRSHSPGRRLLKNILLLVTVAAIGVALARPQWGEQAELSHALGEDVLFIVDCSRSMLAGDVRPNRLTRSKLAIMDFVQRHGSGRVGVIAFSGQAFLQCPMTYDYDAFRESLMALDDQTIPVPGSDIARALDEAFLAMEKDSRRKVMVLVTDGEDLEQGGVNKAKALGEKGVQIFSIGVGTEAGTTIQVQNPQGGFDPLRDDRGNPVESRLDEKTLRAIAEATHGEYQPLGPLGEGMDRVRRALLNTTGLPGLSPSRRFGVDRFHAFVALALALLAVESLIGTRRRVSESKAKPR